MNVPTDWASAIAILAAGLVLGTIVFFAVRRRKGSALAKRRALEARRDALVQQLRDLGKDAADEDRGWLERETAEVLQALDGLPAAPPEDAQPERRPRSAAFGFAWGVACTLIASGIIYFAMTSAREKTNTEEQLAAAKDAFARNDLMGAFDRTNAVLAQNPDDARALTYNAVVRMSMGEMDKASTMLEHATQKDPKLLDAWIALAQARIHTGQTKEAAAAIESAIAQHPEEEKRIREVFATMTAAKKEPSNLPPDHPPIPSAENPMATAMPMTMPPNMPTTMPPVTSAMPIHITVSLDPKITSQGGTLYVIARGTAAGHPVAVRRIDTNAFPVSIDLGANDAMMGGPLPAKLRIEARLDSDGDAGTNDPKDLRAAIDGVTAGASVELALARLQ